MANPFLPDIPTSPAGWPWLRGFLESVKNRIEKIVQNPDPPDPVTGLKVTSQSAGVQLTWNPANRATGYVVYRAQNSNLITSAFAIAQLARADNVSFFDVGGQGTTGQLRTYWIQSVNGPSLGPLSAPASTTEPNIVAPGSITTTEIADNAISTPKLQANSVTAAKISVTQLSAITADMGTLTAGTVVGAVIKTASSGSRVELDSTNGLRGYAGSTLVFQFPLDGSGLFLADNIKPITASVMTIYSPDGNNFATVKNSDVQLGYHGTHAVGVDSSGIFLSGADIKITNNKIFYNAASSAAIKLEDSPGAVNCFVDLGGGLTSILKVATTGVIITNSKYLFFDNGIGIKNNSDNAKIELPSGQVKISTDNGSGYVARAKIDNTGLILDDTTATFGGTVINSTGNAAIGLASTPAFRVVLGGTAYCLIDQTSAASPTNLSIWHNGSLKTVKIDNSDLGSGTKNYLYV